MQPLLQGHNAADIAKGIGISLVLFALAVMMPLIGFFFSLLMPLPILFYRIKLGRSGGLLIAGCALTIMALVAGSMGLDVLFFGELLLLGFCLSELFERRLTVEKTIGYSCAVVLAAALTALFFYSLTVPENLIELVSAYVAHNLELSLKLYEGMGVSESTLTAISNSLDKLHYVLVRILPSLATVSLIFIAWSNLLLCRPLLASRCLPGPQFGDLKQWKAPENLIWLLIACGGCLIAMPSQSIIWLAAINGLLILLIIYFFQGIAIVAFFLESKKAPRAVRVLAYSLIGLQQLFLVLVIAMGIFDLWVDFRKLTRKENRPPEQ